MDYNAVCLGTRITNEATCKAAAADLDLVWGNSWNGPGDHPGCFHTKDSRNRVFFNTSPKASLNPSPNYAEICTEGIILILL